MLIFAPETKTTPYMGKKIEIHNDMILLDADSYNELIRKIDTIYDYVSDKLDRYREREDDRLVDAREVALHLDVSTRTVYRRAEEGLLPYYDSDSKMMFRIGDIKDAVANRLFKTTKQRLNNLIDNHKVYSYEKIDIRENK